MKVLPMASLALVLALAGCANERKPIESKVSAVQKDYYVATTDVQPAIGFDEDLNEWFWGATFKTFSVPKGTELKCEVIALASDKKTELASYEYPHIVANNGTVVPLGDFAVFPSAEKSIVKAIKTFKITCKKW